MIAALFAEIASDQPHRRGLRQRRHRRADRTGRRRVWGRWRACVSFDAPERGFLPAKHAAPLIRKSAAQGATVTSSTACSYPIARPTAGEMGSDHQVDDTGTWNWGRSAYARTRLPQCRQLPHGRRSGARAAAKE
jgi:hypothetical protein